MLRETELICRCCFALYLNYKQTNKKLFTPARIAWNCLKRALLLLFSFFFSFLWCVCVCLFVCLLVCSHDFRDFFLLSPSVEQQTSRLTGAIESHFFLCALFQQSAMPIKYPCALKKKKKTSKWNKKRGKRREIRWRATPWRYAISLIWKRVD